VIRTIAIEPPSEIECPNCQVHLNERLVSNSGHWLVIRYFCRKCDYSSVRHIERPQMDPLALARSLVGDSNYAG
jgi:hypothetical protein